MKTRGLLAPSNLRAYSLIVVGSFLQALSYVLFLAPYKIVPGGVYGISIVIHHVTKGVFPFLPDGFPMGITALCFNIPLMILAMRKIGLSSGPRTIATFLLISVFTDTLSYFLTEPLVEDDAFMDGDDEWIEDPGERLKFQLKLYEIFKQQSQQLRGLETINRFTREPQFTEEDAKIVIKSFNLEKLIDAYGKILFNFSDEDKRTATKKIARDTYTVAEKIVYITTVLSEKKSIEFSQLFTSVYNKSEVIATFSALLELMKKQVAKAEQKELFGEIYITLDDNFDITKADMRELVKIDEEEGN